MTSPTSASSDATPLLRHLIDALGSPTWPVRAQAFDALQALGDGAVPSLVAGTTHPDARVRAESVALMDHLADARCLDPLVTALHDRSAHVRRVAVHAIGCQRCKIAPLALDIVGLLVERALEDPSPRVRRVAVHQLGLQPADPRAVLALETVLREQPDKALRSRAEFALAQQRANLASPEPMVP